MAAMMVLIVFISCFAACTRSRQALEDPAQRTRTVSDIAYSFGFSDLSHFARRFKAEFGRSPSECRPGTR